MQPEVSVSTLEARGSHGPVQLGVERFLKAPPDAVKGARLGLLMNQASVAGAFRYASDLVAEKFSGQLKALFSPQHGFWGEEQANMVESSHGCYAPLNLPVFSLYSETRRPTAEMLDRIDVLLVDLQDVGTRVYTFIWTMRETLEACAEQGVRVVVLDRPNPLGGLVAEGPLLQPDYRSFVGEACIPLRHGLTIGELALLFNAEAEQPAELKVIPMTGWRRGLLFPRTGRDWVAPSPNMPRWETAVVYPGQVLLEGTNLSEGRGTTLPFELCGAPYLDEQRFAAALNQYQFPGVVLRPIRFRPTFDKWSGEICRGVALHVTDPTAVRSVALSVAIIITAAAQAPHEFRWLDPPYEYEFNRPPIDILFGSPVLRQSVERERKWEPAERSRKIIEEMIDVDAAAWNRRVAPFLLYAD